MANQEIRCPVSDCSCTFADRNTIEAELKAHLAVIHVEYLPYKCLYCVDHCLPTRKLYKEHYKSQHTRVATKKGYIYLDNEGKETKLRQLMCLALQKENSQPCIERMNSEEDCMIIPDDDLKESVSRPDALSCDADDTTRRLLTPPLSQRPSSAVPVAPHAAHTPDDAHMSSQEQVLQQQSTVGGKQVALTPTLERLRNATVVLLELANTEPSSCLQTNTRSPSASSSKTVVPNGDQCQRCESWGLEKYVEGDDEKRQHARRHLDEENGVEQEDGESNKHTQEMWNACFGANALPTATSVSECSDDVPLAESTSASECNNDPPLAELTSAPECNNGLPLAETIGSMNRQNTVSSTATTDSTNTLEAAETSYVDPKTGKKRKAYRCELCDKTYPTGNRWAYHKKAHKRTGRYRCERCQLSFAAGWAYRRHCFKEHEQAMAPVEELFHCRFCNMQYSNRSNCRKHERIRCTKRVPAVVAKTSFRCGLCDMGFADRAAFRKHEVVKHPKRQISISSSQSSSSDIQLRFACTHRGCSKAFSSESSLKKHRSLKHKRRTVVSPDLERAKHSAKKSKPAATANEDAKSSDVGKQHMCLKCKVAVEERSLTEHVFTVHLREKSVLCPVPQCIFGHFYSLPTVVEHIRSTHTDVADFATLKPMDNRPEFNQRSKEKSKQCFPTFWSFGMVPKTTQRSSSKKCPAKKRPIVNDDDQPSTSSATEVPKPPKRQRLTSTGCTRQCRRCFEIYDVEHRRRNHVWVEMAKAQSADGRFACAICDGCSSSVKRVVLAHIRKKHQTVDGRENEGYIDRENELKHKYEELYQELFGCCAKKIAYVTVAEFIKKSTLKGSSFREEWKGLRGVYLITERKRWPWKRFGVIKNKHLYVGSSERCIVGRVDDHLRAGGRGIAAYLDTHAADGYANIRLLMVYAPLRWYCNKSVTEIEDRIYKARPEQNKKKPPKRAKSDNSNRFLFLFRSSVVICALSLYIYALD